MTKGRGVRLGAMFAVAMGTFGIAPAWAWEPVPQNRRQSSTVTRVLDVGRFVEQVYVALAESPVAGCAAVEAPRVVEGVYGEAWVRVTDPDNGDTPSAMLAIALAARAQNLPVRVTLRGSFGVCEIVELRTCVDAAACALPPAP